MKKLLTLILLMAVTLLAFAACTNGDSNENDNADVNGDTSGNDGTVNQPTTDNANILIAYFSCTNVTESIAKHILAETKGTLYQIIPETPYTADDLKYYTDCRADREQADSNARPAISGSVDNFEKYGVVFLGYPIWHGQAPRIISTFLESYDFSEKTIIPFCTSHSSGIGNSDTNLHALAASAEWLSGRRFSSETSQQVVADWIKSFNLNLTPEEQEVAQMYITINSNKLEVTLDKNSAVDALVERLKQGNVTYTANDYGGFEKVGGLGFNLPAENSQITTQSGDVILYAGNQIVLFYGSNTWSYTRLGKIEGYSASELRLLLCAGENNIQVTISLK